MAFGVMSAFLWGISIGVAMQGHGVCVCLCSFQLTLPPTMYRSSSCNTSLAKLGVTSHDATLPVSSVSGCCPALQTWDLPASTVACIHEQVS